MSQYGYCRISTPKQSIERQIRNILAAYPNAKIYTEVYTGTEFQGREEFNKLLRVLKEGDTVIFDSVSRMSRDAREGFAVYKELYEKGIELIFLKEPHINTETFKKASGRTIPLTDTKVDIILDAVNTFLLALAEEQIQIAFEQSQKEVDDLRQRTKEGLISARARGKTLGRQPNRKYETKKGRNAKEYILKHNKSFGGNLTNEQTWKLAGICRNSFYTYKKELIAKNK